MIRYNRLGMELKRTYQIIQNNGVFYGGCI